MSTIPLRCKLFFHDWDKWSEGEVYIQTHLPYGINTENLRGASREVTKQTRCCKDCGKKQEQFV